MIEVDFTIDRFERIKLDLIRYPAGEIGYRLPYEEAITQIIVTPEITGGKSSLLEDVMAAKMLSDHFPDALVTFTYLKETVEAESTIYSDEFTGYSQVSKNGYKHERIDHSKEYAVGNIHTNSIESFWSVLKRGIVGIYYHVSTKYLQLYVNEFAFRWNNREIEDMFGLVVRRGVLV